MRVKARRVGGMRNLRYDSGRRSQMLRWGIFLFMVVSASARPGALDRTFRPWLPADARVQFVFEQADRSLLVAGETSDVSLTPALARYAPPYPFFVRLRPNGRLDPSFNHQREPFTFVGIPSAIVERSNGDLVVKGGIYTGFFLTNSYGEVEGPFFNGTIAAILSRNGEIQYRYAMLPPEQTYPSALRRDGSIVYGVSGDFSNIRFRTVSPDAQTIIDGPWLDTRSHFLSLQSLPDGHVVGLTRKDWYSNGIIEYFLRSEQWGALPWARTSLSDRQFRLSQPFVVAGPAQSLYVAGRDSMNRGSLTEHYGVGRFMSNWVEDTSFRFQLSMAPQPTDSVTISPITALRDGGLMYFARVTGTNHVTNTFLGRSRPNGSPHRTFNAGTGPGGEVQGMLTLRKGRVLIWGTFTDYNGRRVRGFVRIKT
jgi:hypothetical protein